MLPPRVLLVMPEQWRRALLRAALREVGYDAVGSRGIREALKIPPTVTDRGPVRLVVLDHDAIVAGDSPSVSTLLDRFGHADAVLLGRATVAPAEGRWRAVLRRPFSVQDVLEAVQASVPLSPGLRRPVDEERNSSPNASD